MIAPFRLKSNDLERKKKMLKGIPKIISPDLLKYLSEMGHSDRLVIADGNFPSASFAKNSKLIRMDGHNVPEILDAILQIFPLDTHVDSPVTLMEKWREIRWKLLYGMNSKR